MQCYSRYCLQYPLWAWHSEAHNMLKSLQTSSMCYNVTGFGCVLHLYSIWAAKCYRHQWCCKVDAYISAPISGMCCFQEQLPLIRNETWSGVHASLLEMAMEREREREIERDRERERERERDPGCSGLDSFSFCDVQGLDSSQCSGGFTSPRPDCCPIWSACVGPLRLEQVNSIIKALRVGSLKLQVHKAKLTLGITWNCLRKTVYNGWKESLMSRNDVYHLLLKVGKMLHQPAIVHVLSFCWCGRGTEGKYRGCTETYWNVWHFAWVSMVLDSWVGSGLNPPGWRNCVEPFSMERLLLDFFCAAPGLASKRSEVDMTWPYMTNVDSCLLMSDFVRLRLGFSSFQHVARFDSQNLVSGGLQTFCSLPTRGCRIYCRKQLAMILPSCKIQHGENGCLIEEKDFQEREREKSMDNITNYIQTNTKYHNHTFQKYLSQISWQKVQPGTLCASLWPLFSHTSRGPEWPEWPHVVDPRQTFHFSL